MNRTETTYRLSNKLDWQRKWRPFAEYVVIADHRTGRAYADVSYFDYKTGKRQASFLLPIEAVAAKVAEWARRDNSRVFFSHYEVD